MESKRILTPSAYREAFSHADRKFALEQALDIRKFEIGLYWQRSTYFWTLIGAALAGYSVLRADAETEAMKSPYGDDALLLFVLSCLGLILSLAWFLGNLGSKYWQGNWERHVDALEGDVMGPLYKMTVARSASSGFPYSVSRLNQYVSFFVVLLWLVLAAEASPFWGMEIGRFRLEAASLAKVIGFLTIAFTFILLTFTLPRSKRKSIRRIDFTLHPLGPAKERRNEALTHQQESNALSVKPQADELNKLLADLILISCVLRSERE